MPLIRCNEEFHKWIMQRAQATRYSVSQILEQLMVKEIKEPGKEEELDGEFKKRVEKDVRYALQVLEDLVLRVEEVEEKLGEGEEGEEGEKLEKIKGELGQVDQGKFICDCGEGVDIEENTETSWLDGVEWVVCPNCDSKRRKEYLEKKGGEK